MFSRAVLPHSPWVVFYHLMLRQETRIPRGCPFLFIDKNVGIFFIVDRNPVDPQCLGSCEPLKEEDALYMPHPNLRIVPGTF